MCRTRRAAAVGAPSPVAALHAIALAGSWWPRACTDSSMGVMVHLLSHVAMWPWWRGRLAAHHTTPLEAVYHVMMNVIGTACGAPGSALMGPSPYRRGRRTPPSLRTWTGESASATTTSGASYNIVRNRDLGLHASATGHRCAVHAVQSPRSDAQRPIAPRSHRRQLTALVWRRAPTQLRPPPHCTRPTTHPYCVSWTATCPRCAPASSSSSEPWAGAGGGTRLPSWPWAFSTRAGASIPDVPAGGG